MAAAAAAVLRGAPGTAHHLIRAFPPDEVAAYASAHDSSLWESFKTLVGYTAAHGDPHEAAARSIVSVPFGQGDFVLRSMQLLRPAAHWAAWADILPILAERVPELLARVQPDLDRQQSRVPCVAAALAAERAITSDHFAEKPSWRQLLDGERPPQAPPDAEPGSSPHGW